MYHDELNREGRILVQGWQAILRDLSRAWGKLRLVLGLRRSQTLSTFEVHRVPGTDTLR